MGWGEFSVVDQHFPEDGRPTVNETQKLWWLEGRPASSGRDDSGVQGETEMEDRDA